MTGNMSYLSDFKEFDGGYVTFGGGAKGEKITGKGTLKIGKLDFEDVLLKVPRKNNMYSIDIKNIIPKKSLTCLVAKATLDESMLWHRRLGHVNFKTINKLVKENLVRGLLSKRFENDQTCVAFLKGKQHKASCKSKIQNSITQPLFMLHMDLFAPTFVSSLMNKKYCLVVTDDYSRFTWVFFLETKYETTGILKSFITEVENLVDKKVKIIKCDNGTEFKNRVMSEFCEKKGIKKEFSVARTPQQNGVAKRRNRTLIEAARTMLADSKLPTTFWAKVVNTAYYVQNRVLVVKPHNKTPYELFKGRTPVLSFMRPFGCHVTILNTLDYLGKFDGKLDEGFFIGYSMNSKAFRVYNIRTRKVEENLHIRFLEDKPIIAGTEESIGAGHSNKETRSSQDYILMPLWKDGSLFDSSSKNASNDEPQPPSDAEKKDDDSVSKESGIADQERPENNTQGVNTDGPSINAEPDMFSLEDNATLEATHTDFFGDETEVDMSNITTTYLVPSTPNTRIHKDHSLDHVIGDVQSGVQTRRMIKTTNKQWFISDVYEGKTHEDLHTCLFACFLSQEEPKRIVKALSDSAWVEAMQKELLQFKLQNVWVLVDLPKRKRAISTKWVFRNKKDERGIVIQNKVRLVAQGHTQKEGIDYDEVFAPVARIKAIRLFLTYASFMGFMVYQMDAKSAFLYGRIEEEVFMCQPPGFEDPDYPDKVYKVVKALYGLHQAPRAWYETLAKYLLDNGFHRGKIDQTLFIKKQKRDILLVQMSSMGELTFFLGLQVNQKEDGIFISKDKYVADILRKFSFTDVRITSTPMDTEKPLLKDLDGDDYVHVPDSKSHLSDYVGASLDRKSTIGGCQFLGCRLISWQCKKQTVVATSSTEAEYVAAASCCGQGIVVQGEGLTHLESVVPQPRSPTQSPVADEAASTDDLEDPSKQGRKIAKIDQDPAISLVQHDAEIQGRHEHDMEFDFDLDAAKDVSTAKPVSTAGVAVTKPVSTGCTASPTRRVSTADDITMAETLVYIRKSAAKDKGKGKMDESEPVQTKTKLQQEQERLGYEAAVRLQAELEEEERQRIARVHEAASSFNVEEWEDIQARVEADEELAQRLQAEEREMYTEAEQARMLVELINQRKRYFAAQRAEERRNKPPTQAQQRTYMSNYIKHMGSHTLQQLRGYSFDEIKTLFETTMRRVNTFVPIESEVDKAVPKLAAGSSKRDAKEELDQESSKRQNVTPLPKG
ncbi:retrovirus-related pol polyprotein from transposon TNT 1-94 [Tanacetum coccineum]